MKLIHSAVRESIKSSHLIDGIRIIRKCPNIIIKVFGKLSISCAVVFGVNTSSAATVPDYGYLCSSYASISTVNDVFGTLATAYHDGALGFSSTGITSSCPTASEEIYKSGYLFQVTAAVCGQAPEINGQACVAYKGPAPIDFIFFNGVFNDVIAADNGRSRLEKEFPGPYKGASVKHTLFYNPTACREGIGKLLCLKDIAQTFDQRSDALDGVLLDRWGSFWEIISFISNKNGSYTMTIGEQLGGYYSAWFELIDSVANAAVNKAASILASLVNSPPTGNEVTAQAESLAQMVRSRHSFYLFAHSQGNLYQKAVYEKYSVIWGSDPNQFQRAFINSAGSTMVGIAPPINPVYYGSVLADTDLVINGLRVLGVNSVPLSNVSMPFSVDDISGHELQATYLDKSRPAYSVISSGVNAALNNLLQ